MTKNTGQADCPAPCPKTRMGDWNKLDTAGLGLLGVLQQLLFMGLSAMLFCPKLAQNPKPTQEILAVSKRLQLAK